MSFCHSSWLSIELGDKTQLLKTPHTVVARCRETKLELNWKFSPCVLVSAMPEGGMQDAREQRHQWSYPTVNPMNYKNNLPSKMCIVAWLFFIQHKNPVWVESTGGTHTWYCKPSQNPWPSRAEVLGGEYTTIALLSAHGFKLPSRYWCLYS